MDFSLIEKHPWATVGIVAGGGFLLFAFMRRSSAPASVTGGTQYVGVDPATAAAQAQTTLAAQQGQTYIAGLNLQGATQVSLAQIGADVSKYSTSASAGVVNNQTAGQVAVGLGTINAQVEMTAIQAGLQSKYIDAIIAAFTGKSPSVSSLPVSTTPYGSYTPTSQITPAQSVYIPTPDYSVPQTVGGTNPGTLPPGGSWYCPPGHDCDPVSGFDRTARMEGQLQSPRFPAPLAGGTLLVPYPNYATCDPRDVACVMGNQGSGINWENFSISANTMNNRDQCLANAELSRGFPNYSSLVAACG